MSEENKPLHSSLHGELGKQGGEGWGDIVLSSATLSQCCNNSTHYYCRVSLSGQFYRVACCDWSPMVSKRAIFHYRFHCPRSRSSILCRCLRCLRPPPEAGWPRQLMAVGLAGRAHPSAEPRALSFIKRDLWEEKRNSSGWERKRGWGREEEGTCIRHGPVLCS